jgi:hypothetical protein
LRHQFDDCKEQQWEESHASPCRDIHSTSFSAAWTDKPAFFTPADCQLYLELLQEAAARYECHVHAYRTLFSAHIAPDQLHAIRHTANQKLVPGSGAFKQQVENMLNRQTEERPRGRPRKARGAGEY